MAIPPNALRLQQPLDPSDRIDYEVELLTSESTTALLEEGESVASFTLALTIEAIDAGLRILTSGGYQTLLLAGNIVKFWLEVLDAEEFNPRFDGEGVLLAIELTVTTDSVPPRVRQRSVVVQVANQ